MHFKLIQYLNSGNMYFHPSDLLKIKWFLFPCKLPLFFLRIKWQTTDVNLLSKCLKFKCWCHDQNILKSLQYLTVTINHLIYFYFHRNDFRFDVFGLSHERFMYKWCTTDTKCNKTKNTLILYFYIIKIFVPIVITTQ